MNTEKEIAEKIDKFLKKNGYDVFKSKAVVEYLAEEYKDDISLLFESEEEEDPEDFDPDFEEGIEEDIEEEAEKSPEEKLQDAEAIDDLEPIESLGPSELPPEDIGHIDPPEGKPKNKFARPRIKTRKPTE